jgi:hypothetical protein
MFDYNKLEVTGKFYIEFLTKFVEVEVVEDLIRYWYRTWFNKFTSPSIYWIHVNTITNAVVEVQVNLSECLSNHYIEKDFICNTNTVVGENRRSLAKVLLNGVSNNKTKINKVGCAINILNEYRTKLDIPNPYLVHNFNVTNTNELTELINKLIDKEDKKLNELITELDTSTKYNLMRQQLDKLEKLQRMLELATDLY